MDQARIGHEALPLARPSAASERELAFGAFVERALPQNYRLARAILGDPAEAEDATHDAFELAWKRWHTLRDPDLLDAWFGRIDGTGAGALFIYDEQWGRVLVFLETDGSYLEQWATRGPQPPHGGRARHGRDPTGLNPASQDARGHLGHAERHLSQHAHPGGGRPRLVSEADPSP